MVPKPLTYSKEKKEFLFLWKSMSYELDENSMSHDQSREQVNQIKEYKCVIAKK